MMRSFALLCALLCGVAFGASKREKPQRRMNRAQVSCIRKCNKDLPRCVKSCQGEAKCLQSCADTSSECMKTCGPLPQEEDEE